MNKYQIAAVVARLSFMAGDNPAYDVDFATKVGNVLHMIKCDHKWEHAAIMSIDCECALSYTGDVHDVFQCLHCGFEYHETKGM